MRIAATILAGACAAACTVRPGHDGSPTGAVRTLAVQLWYPATAVAANAPVEVINLPRHQHGFDGRDDNDESRRVIRATVSFVERQLRAAK
jgi:hypothetical protein